MDNRKPTGNKLLDSTIYGINLESSNDNELVETTRTKMETVKHIKKVNKNIDNFTTILKNRVEYHDESKLSGMELEYFSKYGPLLKTTEYMSDDYKKYLEEMKPGLDHHYAINPHHPEFHLDGINDMNLFDLIEMLMDWYASTKRTESGDIYKSLEINSKRFDIPDALTGIMKRTMDAMSTCYLYMRDIGNKNKPHITITSDNAEDFINQINNNDKINFNYGFKIMEIIDDMIDNNLKFIKVEHDNVLIMLQFTTHN